ncbi:hypothetical protein WS81_02060 [Burkholderia sp. MSMB2040]|nr:hypothetical protein WS81_02060 [Burkholderia sp. MSMB2040]KWC88162.1 hypothetical protein WL58_07300 [Burkholderia cepacia]
MCTDLFAAQAPLPRNLLGFGRTASAWSKVVGTGQGRRARHALNMSSQPAFYVFEAPKQPLGVRQAANRRKGLRIASSVAADACDRLMEIVGKFFYGQE